MSPFLVVVGAAGLVALLYLAYKIGKVVLRLAAGLAFIALIAAGAWYYFKKPRPTFHPLRSQHGSHLLSPLRS